LLQKGLADLVPRLTRGSIAV